MRLVRETGKPIAQVARDLGINEGTLGKWVNADRRRRGDGNGELSFRGNPAHAVAFTRQAAPAGGLATAFTRLRSCHRALFKVIH